MVIEVYKRATSADWATPRLMDRLTARLTSRETTLGARLTDWHAPLPGVIDPLGAAFLLAFSHEKLTATTGTEKSQQQEEFETRNGLGGMRHEACTLAQGRKCFTCVLLLLLPTDNFVCITFECSAIIVVVVAAIATLQPVSATSEVPLCRSQCFREFST